ncbi:MAG: bifunctional 3-(3-hydroxy-phenyl)propionate/3-hydroxycinnamic acid hydroxylase [Pseudomonadota bacterium]
MNAPLSAESLSPPAAVSHDAAHYPVVIVGAGPTGLMLANLLGVQGIKTLVIERSTNTVGEPRAVTIDDESLRTVQATGLIRQVLPSVVQGYGVHYFSWRNREFARIEPSAMENGFPKRNAFRQQVLVGQLRDGLQRFDHAGIWFGHELVSFSDEGLAGEAVHLQLRHGDETKRISCQWLIACDGGRSPVREQLGIKLTGSSYDEKWLIVDLLNRTSPFRHTRTYCDPVRPAIRLPGPQGTLRYEFMLHEGEDPEQIIQESVVRDLIRAREPEDAGLEITRKVVYAFHARVAESWRKGRVFLAGDAAHLTPPFAGQGMNSGVRDAANLAWKLAAVVRGQMPASLLDTYEPERKPHAWSLIQMAVRIGQFMQPKSRFAAMLTQGALKVASVYRPVRDYVLQLKFKPKPRFFAGFFTAGEAADAIVPAGQLLPQPMVELPGGVHVLLDDELGEGFALLTLAGSEAAKVLGNFRAAGLACRHIAVVAKSDDFLLQPGETAAPDLLVQDFTGTLENIMRSAGADALLLRPDRYVLAYVDNRGDASRVRVKQLLASYASSSSPTLVS